MAWEVERAQGRIIHIQLDITLIPENTLDPGPTDGAMELGVEIVDELAAILRQRATNEGFKVEIERRGIVY